MSSWGRRGEASAVRAHAVSRRAVGVRREATSMDAAAPAAVRAPLALSIASCSCGPQSRVRVHADRPRPRRSIGDRTDASSVDAVAAGGPGACCCALKPAIRCRARCRRCCSAPPPHRRPRVRRAGPRASLRPIRRLRSARRSRRPSRAPSRASGRIATCGRSASGEGRSGRSTRATTCTRARSWPSRRADAVHAVC